MNSRQIGHGGHLFPPIALRGAALIAVVVLALLNFGQGWAGATESADNPVVATVGAHKIDQQQVDKGVLRNLGASQLYDLRKQSLDSIVDDYAISDAAKKAGLSPGQYMDRELRAGAGKVTEAEARKFYEQHKEQIQKQAAGRSYDQIKGLLVAALQRQQDQQKRQDLIAKLRSDDQVRITLAAPRVNVAGTQGHPWTGGKNARVTMVEFSDFQCPFCRAAESSVKAIREKYGDQVKLVYMDFPLSFHQHAMDAARAGRCAADQDKFWQYHDALFADQSKLDPRDLKATAARVGLNATKFNACLDKNAHDDGINKDAAEGKSLGVTGTPTFFINGREVVGAQPPPKFTEVIDDELTRAKAPDNRAQAKAN